MKILASFLAISEGWNSGICSKRGSVDNESGFTCRTNCNFDWIGRNEKIEYKEFGKSENGFLAQLSAHKWGVDYLGKEDSYVGMLRFDRTYCKRAILRGNFIFLFTYLKDHFSQRLVMEASILKFLTEITRIT